MRNLVAILDKKNTVEDNNPFSLVTDKVTVIRGNQEQGEASE